MVTKSRVCRVPTFILVLEHLSLKVAKAWAKNRHFTRQPQQVVLFLKTEWKQQVRGPFLKQQGKQDKNNGNLLRTTTNRI